MKASLKIEAIYDNVDQEIRFWSTLCNDMVPGMGTATFGKPPLSYWAARITGTDSKFGYKREFLHGKKDYKFSNSKGSRGVFVYYTLESGNVYEVKGRRRRFFCAVRDNGDIVDITKEEVDQWIQQNTASE